MTTYSPRFRHRLHRRAARDHRDDYRRWRKEQAEAELKYWLDHCGFGSADAYNESPSRFRYNGRRQERRSVVSWIENEMRKHETYSDVLSQKRAHLRARWRLPSYLDMIVR